VPFRFSGDLALNAILFGGACSDLNVMTRRGAWRSEVSIVRAGSELADADVLLLLGITGAWQIDAGATDHDATWPLAPDTALLWRRRCGALWATPSRPHGDALLQVRLCQDRR
jgi:environmental stress-induced protein Ves